MNTLQELLFAAGLARVSKEITKVALPSIRLQAHAADETQIKRGASKLWGNPDLPQGIAWPERNGLPLPFVGQINLPDVKPYDTKHLLPEVGMLYFFFDIDAFFNTWPRDRTTWHVLHDGNIFQVLQRVTIPEIVVKRRRYHPSIVDCSIEMTLPDYSQYDHTSIQRLGVSEPLTDEEEQAYYEVQAQLAGTHTSKYHIPIHRLLGHPDQVQWDMHDDLEGTPTDWQLLSR
jgi:hypothetical protein